MITKKHLRDVCLLHGGASSDTHRQCKYLVRDNKSWSKYMCCKKVPKQATIIEIETDKFLKTTKKNGQDPKQQGRPLGDNCAGYPYFRFKKQGYDVDGQNTPTKHKST